MIKKEHTHRESEVVTFSPVVIYVENRSFYHEHFLKFLFIFREEEKEGEKEEEKHQ